jgi:exosortase D (VPLPA-CTERM-specific)
MNTAVEPTAPAGATAAGKPPWLLIILVLAVMAGCLLVIYADAIAWMARRWQKEEYNHAYVIPFVAFYLVWLRARDLDAADLRGSWYGVLCLLFGLALQVLGSMSAVFEIAQYGLVIAIWGLAIAAAGAPGLRVLWVPLVYLLFMVPLANFIETRLTGGLQLLSSKIGVAVIRASGSGVYLEGNVIDLGTYQLQVAEACSGLRYLFPLMSFGFLCAVLFRGRWWQRTVLFLATIPITILMNSIRIGIIGILVNAYGIEQAEGFLHDFEGWVVFMACVAVLFLIVWVFARMEKRAFLEIFGLDIPPLSDLPLLFRRARPNAQVLVAVGILLAAAAVSLTYSRPPTLVPIHAALQTLPLRIGDWEGREEAMDQAQLDELLASDYALMTFVRPPDPIPVQIWIAYYDSQVQGASVHSPQACLPGGGWRIESMADHTVQNVSADGAALTVNRVVIAQGDQRQLVYYWFAQRGRNITNEFLVKWFIFWDGLTRNRTDGALVRITTYVGDKTSLPEADRRLEAFIRDIDPKLAYYLPGANAPLATDRSASNPAAIDAPASNP